MEEALLELVNEHLTESDVYLESYQKVRLFLYDQSILKEILNVGKFKDIGNVYDFPEVLPQPEYFDTVYLSSDYNTLERIAISTKYNAVMHYSADSYFIHCTILIDTDNLKKFAKKVRPILSKNAGINLFRDVNFNCKKGEYIEVMNSSDDKTRLIDVMHKNVNDENLVFDEASTINEVMKDIDIFFSDKTLDLYKKLEIPYKRGIILYGDPGNGKSAMIREIIRITPDVTKVVINPGIRNVTLVLSSLVKALKGKKAIVVIEDIDSLITPENRSEFLNILDGVDIVSGVLFIGTTNYPDKIDPAFMNRSGRFDRTYEIKNPTEETRRKFFKSRKLGKLLSYYKVFKDDSKPDTDHDIVELFVKNSDNMPMANLKELITSTSYMLVSNPDMTVEEAVTSAHDNLTNTRNEHIQSYNKACDEDDDD